MSSAPSTTSMTAVDAVNEVVHGDGERHRRFAVGVRRKSAALQCANHRGLEPLVHDGQFGELAACATVVPGLLRTAEQVASRALDSAASACPADRGPQVCEPGSIVDAEMVE